MSPAMMLAADLPMQTVIYLNGRNWVVGNYHPESNRRWLAPADGGKGAYLTGEEQYLQVVRAPPTWMP